MGRDPRRTAVGRAIGIGTLVAVLIVFASSVDAHTEWLGKHIAGWSLSSIQEEQ